MFYIIAYDISDDHRRLEVSHTLEAYGERVQKSVFECELTATELKQLLDKLQAILEPDEDNLRCYNLCQLCRAKATILSNKPLTCLESYYIL